MGKRKKDHEDEENGLLQKKIKMEESDDERSSDSFFAIPEEIYNDQVDGYDLNSDDEKFLSKQKKLSKKKLSSPQSSPAVIGKKRKSESIVGPPTSEDISDNTSSFLNGSAQKEKSKKRHSYEKNGFHEDDNASGVTNQSNFVYYLLRKPVDVSLEDLQSLNLPTDPSKSKKVKLRTENITYAMKPVKSTESLIYFPSTTVVTVKDTQEIRSSDIITNQVVLTPVVKEIPGPKIFNEGEDMPEDTELGFEIKSIRKKPNVDWAAKQQRLFSFGSKPEKKRRSKKIKEEKD